MTAAGEDLANASVRGTPTAAYLRSFAAACEVAAHLIRAEAAALDARTPDRSAHKEAADRRAELYRQGLAGTVRCRRPARRAARRTSRSGRIPCCRSADRRSLCRVGEDAHPGSGRHRPPASAPGRPNSAPSRPAAQPLRLLQAAARRSPSFSPPWTAASSRVRRSCAAAGSTTCRCGVQTGEWPDWAERLDAELVTHLTGNEITKPNFVWNKDEHTGDGETYEQSGPVVLRFSLAPGQAAPPLMLHRAASVTAKS